MKTYIYYHIAQMGNWKQVVEEQILLLHSSGLFSLADKIYVGIAGDEPLTFSDSKFEIIKSGIKIDWYNHKYNECELPTLHNLHRRSQSEDFNVLYMHTKGVSVKVQQKDALATTCWRKLMEHYTITQWKNCIDYLKEYDAVGIDWNNKSECFNGHFMGNFWWSKASFIRNLPPVRQVKLYPPHTENNRMRAEFWLGSIDSIKVKSIVNVKRMPYIDHIQPLEYKCNSSKDNEFYKQLENMSPKIVKSNEDIPKNPNTYIKFTGITKVVNPILTVNLLKTMLNDDGILHFVWDNKRCSVDTRKAITYKHLMQDYDKSVEYPDTAHITELVKSYEYKRDRNCKDFVTLMHKISENDKTLFVDFHLIDPAVLVQLVDKAGLEIKFLHVDNTSFELICKKTLTEFTNDFYTRNIL